MGNRKAQFTAKERHVGPLGIGAFGLRLEGVKVVRRVFFSKVAEDCVKCYSVLTPRYGLKVL